METSLRYCPKEMSKEFLLRRCQTRDLICYIDYSNCKNGYEESLGHVFDPPQQIGFTFTAQYISDLRVSVNPFCKQKCLLLHLFQKKIVSLQHQ